MAARRGLAPGGSRVERTLAMQTPADRGLPFEPTDPQGGGSDAGLPNSGRTASSAHGRPSSHLGALVVCGGASTRFGSDKALARIGGATLLERTLDLLSSRTSNLVVATGHEPRYGELTQRFAGLHVALDRAPGLGPLAGLEAGLSCFDHDAEVLVVACDLPNLDAATLDALVARRRALDLDVCLWRDADGAHPLLGCYRAGVLPAVRAALDRGQRRLVSFHSEFAAEPEGIDRSGRDRTPQGHPDAHGRTDAGSDAAQPLRVDYLCSDATDGSSDSRRDPSLDPAANANSRAELERILTATRTSTTPPSRRNAPDTRRPGSLPSSPRRPNHQ